MREFKVINGDWLFRLPGQKEIKLDLPHTWNGHDGQDGGNDYLRTLAEYEKHFAKPQFDPKTQRVYLQFDGVNSESTVILNGKEVMSHEGGYSTFRCDVTDVLQEKNDLLVKVNNAPNDKVYPQKADFTFYGGIYRDVKLLTVSKEHFDLDHHSGNGIWVTSKPDENYETGFVTVETWHNAEKGTVSVSLLDAEGNEVAKAQGNKTEMTISHVHLWDSIRSPYLYTAKATLTVDGEVVDEISTRFGVRDFKVDPKQGFFLNGRSFPLRGSCRHQDRPELGNAITKEMHKEDIDILMEMGANTLRLAHYQHDQYVYDLCDETGLVVWAEIPYISEHMNNGRADTVSQMKELIIQNYNHPSICVWGLSNEITISTKDRKDMLDNHHMLNDMVHKMDPTRPTTLACYAMCSPFDPVAHITDIVSWNLYLGWYTPFKWLNDAWVWLFHTVYPNRCLGYSEYGAEAMPNLHSSHPRRNDHTEEYQAIYHEYMLKFFDRHPYMWATHNWNTFDFAADARDQGGEPGMNHKGLVTFDRKTKKDSFYLYKAWWTDTPFVHICSKRYVNRTDKTTLIKVYSNQPSVALYVNGKKVDEKLGDKVFQFRVPLDGEIQVKAQSGVYSDTAVFRHVDQADPAYVLAKVKNRQKSNWV